MPDPPLPRYLGLDGLRALAVSLVLLQHVSLAGYLGPLTWFPFSGRLGVSLFFVLSGFLITRILMTETNLKRFYLRRALRIFPAFYAYLLALKILPYVGFAGTNSASWWASAAYILNWTPNLHDENLKHTWSLAFEEQFYLVWPFVFWSLRKKSVWPALGVVSCWPLLKILKKGSLTAFKAGVTLQATGYETLAMGCLLALTWDSIAHRRFLPAPISAILLWAMFVLEPWWPGACAVWLPLLRDLLLASLLASTLALPRGRWVAFLENKALVWLGTLSYSLYLWHPLFLKSQTDVIPRGWPCLLAMLGAACLSYYALEKPLLGLRRRLGSAAAD